MAKRWTLYVIEDLVSDRVVEAVHGPVRRFMERHPRLRATLDGSWLGHPLHPALVTIPIGTWVATIALDMAALFGVSGASRGALVTCGVALGSMIPTALAGLAEWSYLSGNPRKVAFVHAISNASASSLLATSLLLRVAGFHATGAAFSLFGFGILGFGGWLGGELAYHYGAGVGRVSSERREQKR